jgi:hypothetical protein
MEPENILFWSYFDDLLLIPCVLPSALWMHQRLGLRNHNEMPKVKEVLLHLLVWSIFFELIAPYFYSSATGDPFDVLAYCIGGIFSWIIWSDNPHTLIFGKHK